MPTQDNIERFFQNATRDPQIPYNEEDWNRLEARLDARTAIHARAVRMRLLVTAGTAILLGLLLGVFLATDDAKDLRSPTENIPASVQSPDGAPQTVVPEVRPHEDAFGPFKSSDGSNKESPATILTQEKHQSHNADGSLTANNQTLNVRAPENETSDIPESKEIDTNLSATPVAALIETSTGDTTASDTTLRVEETKRTSRSASRWSLTLTMAPDFSALRFGSFSSSGEAVGIGAQFQVFKSLAVSAGVTRNTKQYSGEGTDYHPPRGYWKRFTNGIIPESVDGTCTILEVPLFLRYNFLDTRRGRFIVSGGVSSYFLLSESYSFRFSSENPGAMDQWSSDKDSRWMFAVAGAAIAYEHDFSARWSVGIEPYLKMPLKPMGWSQIRLYSVGGAANVRYRILKR